MLVSDKLNLMTIFYFCFVVCYVLMYVYFLFASVNLYHYLVSVYHDFCHCAFSTLFIIYVCMCIYY